MLDLLRLHPNDEYILNVWDQNYKYANIIGDEWPNGLDKINLNWPTHTYANESSWAALDLII